MESRLSQTTARETRAERKERKPAIRKWCVNHFVFKRNMDMLGLCCYIVSLGIANNKQKTQHAMLQGMVIGKKKV